jgi:hypothetical protein
VLRGSSKANHCWIWLAVSSRTTSSCGTSTTFRRQRYSSGIFDWIPLVGSCGMSLDLAGVIAWYGSFSAAVYNIFFSRYQILKCFELQRDWTGPWAMLLSLHLALSAHRESRELSSL